MAPEAVLYETHMHTPLCKHASGPPEAYARVAAKRNLKGIIVTCHNPIPGGYAKESRMGLEQFPDYLELVRRAAQAMAGTTEVHLGLECDYVPGMEVWLEELLAKAAFDYVLGSVHPHIREYRKRYWRGSITDYQELYFEHLAMAAETKLFDALAHPDLVKNIEPDEWKLERIAKQVQASLDRIAASGTVMELNTSGLNKRLPEVNPGPEILRQMQARSIPVVIGSDAHVPERVGDNFDLALATLERASYGYTSFFLSRQRQDVPLSTAQQSLRS